MFSLANIGLAITVLSTITLVIWIAIRWNEGHGRRDLAFEAFLGFLILVGAVISRIATAQSDAQTENIARKVTVQQQQINSLQSGFAPRRLSTDQSDAIVQAFSGASNLTVSIQRCISMESGVELTSDFIEAFHRAGVKLGSGGVNTLCGRGMQVSYNPNDTQTVTRILEWLEASHFHAFAAPDKKYPMHAFTLLLGEKTEQSP